MNTTASRTSAPNQLERQIKTDIQLPVDEINSCYDWSEREYDTFDYEDPCAHREEFWSMAIASGEYQNTPAIDLL